MGMHPYFAGLGRVRIRVASFVEDPEGTPLDGQVNAVLLVSSANDPDPHELCPFAFDSPNFLRVCFLDPIVYHEVQLAGFARELHMYRTEEEFRSSRHGKYATEAFFPVGEFDEKRKTQALLTGRVIESSVKTNPMTGNTFLWVLVKTLGGTVDVVATPDMLNDRLEPGCIVVVGCRLSGLLVEPVVVLESGMTLRGLDILSGLLVCRKQATEDFKKKNFGVALNLNSQALEICRKLYGEDHLDSARSYEQMAAALYHTGDYDRAIECLTKTHEIRRKVIGEDYLEKHPDCANTLYVLDELRRLKRERDNVKEVKGEP